MTNRSTVARPGGGFPLEISMGIVQRCFLAVVFLWVCGFSPVGVIAGDLPERCRLPAPELGECKALLTVAYYDQERNTCVETSYGGCGGVVPFGDIEECRAACETTEELRLTDVTRVPDSPYLMMTVSYPSSWDEPVFRIQANDQEVESRWVGGGNSPGVEMRSFMVYPGEEALRKLSISTVVAGRDHDALTRLYWSLEPQVFLLDHSGEQEALFNPVPLHFVLLHAARVEVKLNGVKIKAIPRPGLCRHGKGLEVTPQWVPGNNHVLVEATSARGRKISREYNFVYFPDRKIPLGETARIAYGGMGSRSGPFYRVGSQGRAVVVNELLQPEKYHTTDATGWLQTSMRPVFEISAVKEGKATLLFFITKHFRLPEELDSEYRLEVVAGAKPTD
ncbi:MAG: BPTI/Kunitz domain-containing protein [Desulfobacterales bacterium]|nr:BPTI/Kunitz domain-containing protein [Desulfobacterales bacterium]